MSVININLEPFGDKYAIYFENELEFYKNSCMYLVLVYKKAENAYHISTPLCEYKDGVKELMLIRSEIEHGDKVDLVTGHEFYRFVKFNLDQMDRMNHANESGGGSAANSVIDEDPT
jgi:hypothetical protein